MVATVSVEEVLRIHQCLVADFEGSDDPLGHGGVRSMGLLESAVHRQATGYQGVLKYETPVLSATSLAYGLCADHPFHNGNKRTSLVALLCHLDKNDLTFDDSISQAALYDFMLNVASHAYGSKGQYISDPDVEVEQMARWIRKRVRRVEWGERIITFRQLKAILMSYGLKLEEPRGNTIEIVRYEKRKGFFGIGEKTVRRRLRRIGNPGDGKTVTRSELKDIRDACDLTERHGIDSHAFYNKVRPIDFFIGKYRGTLRRLAKV